MHRLYNILQLSKMSILVRPISANLTRDTEFLSHMDPYVKIYFGGQQFRTAVCQDGGKKPYWNETFTFCPATDTNMRIEIWDSDTMNDDMVAEGSYNLMQVYNMPSMCSDSQYIDLFYQGEPAGRILIAFELQGMSGYWGQGQMGMGMGQQMHHHHQNPMGMGQMGMGQQGMGQMGMGQQGMGQQGMGQMGMGQMGMGQQPGWNNRGW